ncbi:MAG TPA: hypothetical protein ENH82_13880, partial [bacterium]|nr:hypothetical protein [bacterium]
MPIRKVSEDMLIPVKRPGVREISEDMLIPASQEFSFGGGGGTRGDGVSRSFDTGILPAFKSGLAGSIPGMFAKQEIPPPYEAEGIVERTAQNVGRLVGDLPFYVAGGIAGGASSYGIGAIPGAVALPAGIRKVLMDAYDKGQAKTWEDFKDRAGGALFETAKGAVVGKAVGIAGKYAPGISKVPAEIASMVTAGAAVEGRLPTAQGFIDAALLIGTLHGVTKTASILRKHYARTGEHPKIAAHRINKELKIITEKPPEELTIPGVRTKLHTGKEAFRKNYEQIDWGQPLPRRAASINLEKQLIPRSAKLIELETAKNFPKQKVSWKETIAQSDEIMKDFKRLGKIKTKVEKGEGLNAAEVNVAGQVNVNAITNLKKMAGANLSRKEFNKQFNNYGENIFRITSSGKSEVGRALNIQKRELSPNRMAKVFAKLEKGMNERQFKEFKELDVNNPTGVKQFIARLPDPAIKDYVYEFWYNAILSGIPTHLVNVASNTGWTAFQIPHRALVGGIDKIISDFSGRPRRVYTQEIVPLMAGLSKGFKPGAKRALDVMKSGRSKDFETKWSMEVGPSALSAFERSPYKPLRYVAPAVSGFLRALQAMDVWAKSMGMDGQLRASARREGLDRGFSGQKLKTFERSILKNPTKKMMGEAKEFSKHIVFMDDPGKFTKWIMGFRKYTPWESGRLIVPFVNTIANLTKRGVEKTPGLGLGLELWRLGTKQKRLPIEEVIANQIEGSVLALYILHKADVGEITGRAPENKSEREAFYRQGKLPWAIEIDGKYFQYRRIEPFNTVIASVVIAYEEIKNAEDEDTATEIFGGIVDGLVDNLIDSSYLQGVTNALDKYGRRKGMLQRLAASFVPYSSFWRSINRSLEYVTQGETRVHDNKSLLGS